MFYINLTNGIEALNTLDIKEVKFVRIQSTKCEQKDWNFIIEDLDYNFLLSLALGNQVILIDYSAKKEESRAIYQGISWIQYVLNRRWFKREIVPFVKNNNVEKYFEDMYQNLSQRAKKKLDYVQKFVITDNLNLKTRCAKTSLDSNYSKYKDILTNSSERSERKIQEYIR